MSEMEACKGKLKPMMLRGVTMEERAEDACKQLEYAREDYHSSWLEVLRDEGYKKVYIRDDIIYKVHNTDLDAYGFSEASKNDDASIDYIQLWHNGGAGFDEVLDEAINRIGKND